MQRFSARRTIQVVASGSAGELARAMALFEKYDVAVISDEIWSDLTLPGYKAYPDAVGERGCAPTHRRAFTRRRKRLTLLASLAATASLQFLAARPHR